MPAMTFLSSMLTWILQLCLHTRTRQPVAGSRVLLLVKSVHCLHSFSALSVAIQWQRMYL